MRGSNRLGYFIALMMMTFLVAGCLGPFAAKVTTYDVSGRVTTAAGDGIEDVGIVVSSGLTTDTEGDGTWEATGLKGHVTVTAVKENLLFTPSKRSVGAASSTVDFIGYPLVYVENFDAGADPSWTSGDWVIDDEVLQAPEVNGAWAYADVPMVTLGDDGNNGNVAKILVELDYRPGSDSDASFSLILYDEDGGELNLTVSRIHATEARGHKYELSVKPGGGNWQTVAQEPGTKDDSPAAWHRIRIEVSTTGQVLAFHDDVQVVDANIGSPIEARFFRVGMTNPFEHNQYQFDRLAIAVEEWP